MGIVKHRKIFYIISGALFAASLAALSLWGLNLGIDFKGGSILEVEYADASPEKSAVEETLKTIEDLGAYSVRPTGERGFLIRMRELAPEEKNTVMNLLSADSTQIEEKRFNSIGPVLGSEAARKSWISIGLVLLCIVLFITFAFRKVSKPLSSWVYGVMAIVGLVHDIVIPLGIFSVLGHFAGVEADTLFVTALLVILGYSVHDKIVVFDRIRENLKLSNESRQTKEFEVIAGESIGQTLVRSINTSLTTVFAVLMLYFIGPEATKYFSLALLIGIIVGTYSSIFLGSPLLVTVERWQQNRKSI